MDNSTLATLFTRYRSLPVTALRLYTAMKLADSQKSILDLLKRYGPQSVKVLSRRLDMTTMGIRQHLQDLQKSNLVTTTTESRQTRGRPLHLWRLTAEGHECFPDRHQQLTLELLTTLREDLGESTLAQLIKSQTDRSIRRYNMIIGNIDDLEHRIKALAHARTEDGFMAEVRLLPDQNWLLIENHCPIHNAARNCRNYCESELQLFRGVLGDQVAITRTEYLMQGSRRCAYKISTIQR